jgi:hypothetical protein
VFRKADFVADHYLVVSKVWERLSLSKRATKMSDVEIIDLKKLNDGKVREKYQVILSQRCASFEKPDSRVDTNRA